MTLIDNLIAKLLNESLTLLFVFNYSPLLATIKETHAFSK